MALTRAEKREKKNNPKMRVHGARIRQLLTKNAQKTAEKKKPQ